MLASEQWGFWSACCSVGRTAYIQSRKGMDPGPTSSASQELGPCPSPLSFLIFKMRIISARSLPRDVGKGAKVMYMTMLCTQERPIQIKAALLLLLCDSLHGDPSVGSESLPSWTCDNVT